MWQALTLGAKELGYQFGPFMGNGGDWKNKPGYQTTHEAKTGYAISFSPGQAGADRTYGHHLLPHLQCSRSSTIDLCSWGEVDNYSLKNKRFLACQNLRPFYLS